MEKLIIVVFAYVCIQSVRIEKRERERLYLKTINIYRRLSDGEEKMLKIKPNFAHFEKI